MYRVTTLTRACALIWALAAGEVPSFGEGVLGDRVIIEIENTYFSQYQLECYDLLKAALSDDKWPTSYTEVTATTWNKKLAEFVADMTIQHESQRLGSFFPTDEIVSKAIERIGILEKKDEKFAAAKGRLAIGKQVLVRTVGSVLQVAAFRLGKTGERGDSAKPSEVSDAWFDDLAKRILVRYLDGSRVYKPINPKLAADG